MAASFLAASTIFTGTAQAMEIQQYDKMQFPDQKEYVLLLYDGAQKVLRDSGRPDLAEQVAQLFTKTDPETNLSVGISQFNLALSKARVADLERVKKDPAATRLEVEHAMMMVLKKNGIELPPSFMHVADSFRPTLPVRSLRR